MTNKADKRIEHGECNVEPYVYGVNAAEEGREEYSLKILIVKVDVINDSVNKRNKEYQKSSDGYVYRGKKLVSALNRDRDILGIVCKEVELKSAERPYVEKERKECVGRNEKHENKGNDRVKKEYKGPGNKIDHCLSSVLDRLSLVVYYLVKISYGICDKGEEESKSCEYGGYSKACNNYGQHKNTRKYCKYRMHSLVLLELECFLKKRCHFA